MKLCVCCCTYNRPHLLPRIIRCFEEQDYEDRYMVIFDDGNQYSHANGDRWELVSLKHRRPSLGEKRNRLVAMAPADTYAFLPCDDDDLFLPWHLSSAAATLATGAQWSRPSAVLAPHPSGDWTFRANYTGHRDDPTQERMYHPCWAITLEAFHRVGGYPETMSGPEDKGLMLKMEKAGITAADPLELGFRPSYVYCWGNYNISSMLHKGDPLGVEAWKRLERPLEPAKIVPWEPPFDLHHPAILDGIIPRPF